MADLLALQGRIKVDPEGYKDEFMQQLQHHKACLAVFLLKPTDNDQQLADLTNFIAQVAYCYKDSTSSFAEELMELLDRQGAVLDPDLRLSLVKSLILLRHRGQVAATQTLPLLFKLFRCSDKLLRQTCFRHIVADIKNSNKKHVNEALNRQLQSFLYTILAGDNTRTAKKSLAVLCELYRRGVWRDAKTVNVIATALLHKDVAVMLPAVKFFLGQDEAQDDGSDDESDGEGKPAAPTKEDVYRACKKGTSASKKKKQAKLKRVMNSVRKASRTEEAAKKESFAALQLLHDPQSLSEKLFTRIQSGGLRYETRLLLLTLLSRIVGMHKLLLLNLYPYLQKYIQPHQRDANTILAALVQATHDLVPPEVLAPVLRQLCDQFVHDAARPEAITTGLKTVRELCVRCPLVMAPDLLHDLVGYKKYRNKVVSSAARGLVGLFRELAPGLLEKRDRGRGADMKRQVQQYGYQQAATRVVGADLLEAALHEGEEEEEGGSDDDGEAGIGSGNEEEEGSGDEEDGDVVEEEEEVDTLDGASLDGKEQEDEEEEEDEEEGEEEEVHSDDDDGDGEEVEVRQASGRKRTLDADPESMASLRKRLATAKQTPNTHDNNTLPLDNNNLPLEYTRILTEDDFDRIRELRHQQLVEAALAKHGLKSASMTAHRRDRIMAAAEEEADEMLEFQDKLGTITEHRVTGDDLAANIKWRKDKQARLEMVLKGREGREEFGAAAKRKKAKQGGLSNREKQKRKAMPVAARMDQIRKRQRSTPRKGGGKRGGKQQQGRVVHRFRAKGGKKKK